MPSLTLELPEHVKLYPRKDGTVRVLYVVRRNRPAGWPAAIPLPRTGERRGDLSDPSEFARIVADAEALAAELALARRPAQAPPARPGSFPAVADDWRASGWWAKLRPRTRVFYDKGLWLLHDWSAAAGHPPLAQLTLPRVMAFLATYDDRPSQQANLKRTLSALLSFAREQGVVETHIFGAPTRLRRSTTGRARAVTLWTGETVALYAAAAERAPFQRGSIQGWPGGARMLRLMWETSADASDVVTWRRDKHFRDGPVPAIVFERGKTGRAGVVPISADLAAGIRACGQIYLVTNPQGRPYAPDDVQDDNRRGRDFERVRALVVAEGGPRMIMDHLRHSAVTHAVENGASREATTNLSLHATTKMLDSVYVQMTEAQAIAVQRARGII